MTENNERTKARSSYQQTGIRGTSYWKLIHSGKNWRSEKSFLNLYEEGIQSKAHRNV